LFFTKEVYSRAGNKWDTGGGGGAAAASVNFIWWDSLTHVAIA